MTQGSPAVSSANITVRDASPLNPLTEGEGAQARVLIQDDVIAVTTAMLAAGAVWRLCRIPTTAKVKSVRVMSDAILDNNASMTLALDFNIAFSDATNDGTNPAVTGTIPTTANNGSVTGVTTYTNPNKLFGTLTQSGTAKAIPVTDITFQGQLLYNSQLLPEAPLYQLFGFNTLQGLPFDPGGYFDILVNVATGAATPHAANFYVQIAYAE